jgi:hypothetical protein
MQSVMRRLRSHRPAKRSNPILWIASVAILSLIGASCGGGGGSNSAQSTTTTSTTAPSTGQNIEADKAAAQAASLTLSDFPAGWTSQPSSSTNPDQGISAQLAKCLGVSEAALSKPPAHYDAPNFSDTNNNTASNTVGYRATAADEQSAFAIVSGPKVPGCMTTAVGAVINQAIAHPTNPSNTLPAGAAVGTATVSQMSFPQFGDKSVAYQVKVPVTYQSLSFAAYVDIIYVLKGRAGVSMYFEGVDNPFSIDQAQHYTGLVVGRLTNT